MKTQSRVHASNDNFDFICIIVISSSLPAFLPKFVPKFIRGRALSLVPVVFGIFGSVRRNERARCERANRRAPPPNPHSLFSETIFRFILFLSSVRLFSAFSRRGSPSLALPSFLVLPLLLGAPLGGHTRGSLTVSTLRTRWWVNPTARVGYPTVRVPPTMREPPSGGRSAVLSRALALFHSRRGLKAWKGKGAREDAPAPAPRVAGRGFNRLFPSPHSRPTRPDAPPHPTPPSFPTDLDKLLLN